jgi:effector-binding domain-containing protein
MSYKCESKQQPEQPVLSIRTRTAVQDLPQKIGPGYQAVMAQLAALNEQPAGYPFVAYYNMDMQDLDIEIGFPVSRVLPGQGEVQPGVIPAGTVATCLYTGPYNEMPPAYDALNAWIKDNGYQATGTVYEFYPNSPMDTPPAELQTQIVFPVARV